MPTLSPMYEEAFQISTLWETDPEGALALLRKAHRGVVAYATVCLVGRSRELTAALFSALETDYLATKNGCTTDSTELPKEESATAM